MLVQMKKVVCLLAVVAGQQLAIAQNVNDPVFIWPEANNTSELKLIQTGITYEVFTEGERPVLSFAALEMDIPATHTQLSFDYFSPIFLDELEILFESGGKQVASAFSELSIMEGWSLYTINLSVELKEWGKKGDVIRFRLGRNAGYRMQLRNIRFREMNEFEKKQALHSEANKRRDEEELLSLRKYFDSDYKDSIRSITVSEKQVTIAGYTHSGVNLYLAELPLHVQTHIALKEKQRLKIPGKGNFTFTIDRFVREGKYTRDVLFSKWVIIEKGRDGSILRSNAHYPDAITPKYKLADEQPLNKKGLGDFNAVNAEMVKDIDSLGITSVTVNVWIRGLLSRAAADSTFPFTYNGKTYHANKHWVQMMDSTMLTAAKKKLIVSAIILVDQAIQFSDTTIGKQMTHPDCDPAGVYCMPNVFSPEGMEYYGAAVDFLAARYSRPDKKFGRIHHWIAQNEVDAGWTWTNMGEKDPLLYMDAYHTSLRIIHLIARQYNAHAKTFVSLTHDWNWTPVKRFYKPKELLEILLCYSSKEGDFDWAVGYHPFPQSLFEPKSWLDERTDFSFNTQMITFRNVEVIDAWMDLPHTFYRGKQRLLHFSEQGPNSRDYSETALLDQAASMAYVWKKMKSLKNVKVFHYQSWRDYRFDGGLRLGLRRYPDDEEDPLGRKPVWTVFKYMGTAEEDKYLEFAKPIIGIKDWSEVQYQKPIRVE